MSQRMSGCCWKLRLAISLAIGRVITCSGNYASAQVIPDSTLGSESSIFINGSRSDQIDGGAIRGKNLFHSFQEFNVDEGRGVYFNNPAGIENILGRVTGGNPSNIQGKIGVLGNANLFLLNPNGIIFGADASLDIRGSFVASTASSLNFADGNQFSATTPQTTLLLTVSVPIGLQFGTNPGNIINRSQASPGEAINSLDMPVSVGLQVNRGKTLALVGGSVALEGGNLTAAGGRIELASVANSSSIVSLTSIERGWILGYEGIQNFQDIKLSQEAVVDVSGEGGGDIQIQGRRVILTDASQVLATTQGAKPGGNLKITASESVELNDPSPRPGISALTAATLGAGDAGNITLNTKKLIIRDGSQISTLSAGVLSEQGQFILATGKAGNLTVNASESVEVDGVSTVGDFSGFSSATYSAGDAGDITVNTRRLIVSNGGRITTESSGVALTQLSQFIPATGKGGNLIVNASESVELTHDGLSKFTGLLTKTQSLSDAGNLTLNTRNLTIRDGAEVSVSSEGTGNAGNLDVTAGSIRLESGGKFTATSAAGRGGGNIRLKDLNLLLLRGNSEISTNADGIGNGGNINIDTDLLVGLGNSDITANAVRGRGGNIQINAQGIFGIEPRSQRTPESDITASSELGVDGIVEINRPDVDPTAELVVLPAEIVDVSGLVAQGCPVGGGNLAQGSQFVVTGRGGLPPTPTEATRSDSVLVDLGSSVQSRENSASAAIRSNSTNSEESATLVEAQGWVIGSKGEVILTASAPTVNLDIPWLTPTSCNGS